MQETRVRFLGQEDSLEKEMATHASIPAWRIPLTGGWRALVHGVTGVGRDLMTNPPPGGNCEYCYKKVPALPV